MIYVGNTIEKTAILKLFEKMLNDEVNNKYIGKLLYLYYTKDFKTTNNKQYDDYVKK